MKGITRKKIPYIFVAPTIILLISFSIVPIFIAIGISFTDLTLSGLADWSTIKFVGIENYQNVLKDPVFTKSLLNTLFYVVVGVPLVVVFSLGIALLINFGKARIFKAFRVVFYMPSITNTVAVAVVWNFLYNPQIGLINYVLDYFNLGPIGWLTDPSVAKISLIILAVWKGIGLNMLIFLAALQGIPRPYYEAAQIDGANNWQQLFKITLPLLRFSIFFVSVTTMIGWLQFFEEPFVMTNGGPLSSTMSVALFIYRNGFQLSNFGYAAAGSFILFIIIIIITLIQFKLQNKEADY